MRVHNCTNISGTHYNEIFNLIIRYKKTYQIDKILLSS